MDRLARANETPYFHFLQPNQYVPDSKRMNAEERALAFRPNFRRRPDVERGYPLLQQAARRLLSGGVRVTDLTAIFSDVSEPIYRDYCCHVNARANEILAREIADRIASDPKFRSRSTPTPSPFPSVQ